MLAPLLLAVLASAAAPALDAESLQRAFAEGPDAVPGFVAAPAGWEPALRPAAEAVGEVHRLWRARTIPSTLEERVVRAYRLVDPSGRQADLLTRARRTYGLAASVSAGRRSEVPRQLLNSHLDQGANARTDARMRSISDALGSTQGPGDLPPGFIGPPPPPEESVASLPKKGLKTAEVPRGKRVVTDGDPGAMADWMDQNKEKVLRCPEGAGWWACEGHKTETANMYFNLRSQQCDRGEKPWYACAYYKARRFTTGGAVMLSSDPVEFGKMLTPIGSGESLYHTATGKQKSAGWETALDCAGVVPVLGILKLGKMGKMGRVARTIGKGAHAVDITEDAVRLAQALRLKKPLDACRLAGAKVLPGQPLASPMIVAEYSQRMKVGLWDWAKGEKIVLGVGEKGERVIIEGHHRYMAAKLAGVDIPASAFSQTRRPWAASSWERVGWSASN